jgi:fibronectin-binding autotransporter adhesin
VSGSIGTINIGGGKDEPAKAPGFLIAETVSFGDGTATLNFNHTGEDYEFGASLVSGSADGTHAINHFAGTTILTGDSSTFAGTTTVSGGTLLVNGTLGGDVVVEDDGRLGGNGTVGSDGKRVSIEAGGVLCRKRDREFRLTGRRARDGGLHTGHRALSGARRACG